MTIQQMQYALEIYRANSISKAANQLFMTQSNLSTVLLRMEKELGFPIFLRSNKGIQPTENGRRFLQYASTICANYEDMVANIHAASHRLRIGGAHYTPLKEAFCKLALAYEGNSHLDFSYTVLPTNESLEKLSTASLDLVLQLIDPDAIVPLRRKTAEMGLSMTVQKNIPMVLRIGPHHPLYNEPEIRLTDFQDYTFVDYPGNPFFRNKHISSLLKINENRIVSVHDAQLRKQMVADSSMYSIGSKLPDHLNKEYRFRSIPLGTLSHQVVSFVQKGRTLPEEVTHYLQILENELAAL